jgi:hypothetical protein
LFSLVDLLKSNDDFKDCLCQGKYIFDLFPLELGGEGDEGRCEAEVCQPNDVVGKVVDEAAAG